MSSHLKIYILLLILSYHSFFSVGIFQNGRVVIIPNEQGNLITPSYVAFNDDGKRLIGDSAKIQLASNPSNTIFEVKRFIGRDWDDPVVQKYLKFYRYPFKIIKKKPTNHMSRFQLVKMKGCLLQKKYQPWY